MTKTQSSLGAWGSLLILAFVSWLLFGRRKSKVYKLPPTVAGIPFFGNTFQVPDQPGPWSKKLAEKYGEMYGSGLGFVILHPFPKKL